MSVFLCVLHKYSTTSQPEYSHIWIWNTGHTAMDIARGRLIFAVDGYIRHYYYYNNNTQSCWHTLRFIAVWSLCYFRCTYRTNELKVNKNVINCLPWLAPRLGLLTHAQSHFGYIKISLLLTELGKSQADGVHLNRFWCCCFFLFVKCRKNLSSVFSGNFWQNT